MQTQNTGTAINTIQNYLNIVIETVYNKCGWHLSNLKHHPEGIAYGACSFELNGYTIQYRVSKITPTKSGQFVTIWKRNEAGITEPFSLADDIDFLVITATSGHNFGQFIFPKSVLAQHGIITSKGKEGKRGIRVYPPWDIVTNKQAANTQLWQTKYFLTINKDRTSDTSLFENLFTK